MPKMKQSKKFEHISIFAAVIFLFTNLLFVACSSSPEAPASRDTNNLAQELSEELKTPAEYDQFLWFYSAFVYELTNADSASQLDKYISKEHRLTIIHARGALPHVKRTDTFLDLVAMNYPILKDTNLRSEKPKQESLPVRNCDQPNGWNKTGCYTQEINPIKSTDLWTAAGLREEEIKAIKNSATTVTRTVINTLGVTFYFSLINGTWYLTFIDLRPNCTA
jgi:hypothetical protein